MNSPDKNKLEKVQKFKRVGRAILKQCEREGLTKNEVMQAVGAFVAQAVAAQENPQKHFDGFIGAVKEATELLLTHKQVQNDRSKYN